MTDAQDLPPVLAACPFCGDRFRLTNHTRQNGTKIWRLFCDSETDCFFMDYEDRDEAIEMGNRRSDPVRAELVEALRPFADLGPSSLYADTDNEGYCVTLTDRPVHTDFRRQDVLRARAAIAKAEGSNPSSPSSEAARTPPT